MSFLLLSVQSENMTNKWHVYMTKDGRISLAGLSLAKCEYLADAIIDSFHNVSWNSVKFAVEERSYFLWVYIQPWGLDVLENNSNYVCCYWHTFVLWGSIRNFVTINLKQVESEVFMFCYSIFCFMLLEFLNLVDCLFRLVSSNYSCSKSWIQPNLPHRICH